MPHQTTRGSRDFGDHRQGPGRDQCPDSSENGGYLPGFQKLANMTPEVAGLFGALELRELVFRIPNQLEPQEFAKLAKAMETLDAFWETERRGFVMKVRENVADLLKAGTDVEG